MRTQIDLFPSKEKTDSGLQRNPFFATAAIGTILEGVARRGGDEKPGNSCGAVRATKMPENRAVCCSSPAAMCYWFAISLIAWGVLAVAGVYWYPLHWYSAATILFAAGIGCLANWLRNRSFHCVITGPLFLIAAILFLAGSLGLARVHVGLVWSLLFVGTGAALLLEWKHAKRSAS